MSKADRIASLERQVKYLNQQMQRICDCPWATDDGPRLATSPRCLVHGPKAEDVRPADLVVRVPA